MPPKKEELFVAFTQNKDDNKHNKTTDNVWGSFYVLFTVGEYVCEVVDTVKIAAPYITFCAFFY